MKKTIFWCFAILSNVSIIYAASVGIPYTGLDDRSKFIAIVNETGYEFDPDERYGYTHQVYENWPVLWASVKLKIIKTDGASNDCGTFWQYGRINSDIGNRIMFSSKLLKFHRAKENVSKALDPEVVTMQFDVLPSYEHTENKALFEVVRNHNKMTGTDPDYLIRPHVKSLKSQIRSVILENKDKIDFEILSLGILSINDLKEAADLKIWQTQENSSRCVLQ